VERIGDASAAFRVRWNRNLSKGGGVMDATPTDSTDLPRRFAVMLAGGPLADLILSFAAFATASLPAVAESPVTRLLCLLLGMASAICFVASVIPMESGAGLTDGARVSRLLRGGLAARRDVSLLRLSASIAAGVAPRDWDSQTVRQALQPADGSMFEWQARQLAYRHALERGDTAAAGEHLDTATDLLSLVPKSAQAALRLEAAYFEAWHRARPEFALEWLEGVPVDFALLPSYEHLRATAAIQSALGDSDSARNAVTEALLQIVSDKTAAPWSRSRLIEMADTLDR
jgi:hypothetical protein